MGSSMVSSPRPSSPLNTNSRDWIAVIGEEGDITAARSAHTELEDGADGLTGQSPISLRPYAKIDLVEGNYETHPHFAFGSTCVLRIRDMGAAAVMS
jgi:hypothetical protein